MARIFKGILGGFSGKVGNIVGSTWRGIDVIKSLPKKVNRVPSEKQAAIRFKFAKAISFLKPITDIINMGYQDHLLTDRTAFNEAISNLMQVDMIGDGLIKHFDLSKIKLSKGSLDVLHKLKVERDATNNKNLQLTWETPAGEPKKRGDDLVHLVFYDPATNKFVTPPPFKRMDKSVRFLLEDELGLIDINLWVFVSDEDRREVSNSQFIHMKKVK